MSKSSNSTIWTIGLLGGGLFALWYYLKHHSSNQSSGLGGGVGGGGSDVLVPYNQQQGQQQPSAGLNFGGGGGGGGKPQPATGGSTGGPGGDDPNVDQINQALANADNDNADLYNDPASDFSPSGNAAMGGIASLPLSTLDNLPSQPLPDNTTMNAGADTGSGNLLDQWADFINSAFGGQPTNAGDLTIPTAAGDPVNGYSDTSGLSYLEQSYQIANEVYDASGDDAGNSSDVASYGGSSFDEGGASDNPADGDNEGAPTVADNNPPSDPVGDGGGGDDGEDDS